MAVVELSPEDLAGAEVVSAPKGGDIQLSAEDLAGAEVVSRPALAGKDAGPEARRAATLRPPGPRMQTDDELGIGTGMQTDTSLFSTPKPAVDMFPSAQQGWKEIQDARAAMGLPPARTPEEAGDVMVQTGMLGAGAGAAAGAAMRALGIGAGLTSVGSGAVAGGVSSKTSGGDFVEGAALGGAFPAAVAGANTARKFVAGAPARVRTAAKQGVTTGEQNAGKRLTEKFRAAGGKDDQFIDDLLQRHPELERMAAIKGKASPARVGVIVDDLMETKGQTLDEMYEQMAAQKRLVKPSDISASFDRRIGEALAAGDAPALQVLRQERAWFNREYKNFGALSPETMRGLKATAGKRAWGNQPIPAEVRQDIWRTYADAIEKQAAGSGIDVAHMRQLNKDMQMLGAAKTALDERIVMQKAGRMSLAEIAERSALAATGDPDALKRIARQVATPLIKRRAGEVARTADSLIARTQRGRPMPVIREVAAEDAAALGAALGLESEAATSSQPNGMIEAGNIDLGNRPRVKNADGTTSTVRSLGVNVDGVEVLIPTVSEDGRIMSDDEAVEQYKRTGRHLGKFASVAASNAYAERLHNDQAAALGMR